MSDFRTPAIYDTIASIPDDYTLLELPTGWRNGARVQGQSDVLIMMQQYYQTTHGKRRLGGNTSRNPPYKFQYFVEAPLIGDLIALMNADRDHISRVIETEFTTMVEEGSKLAPQTLDFLGVKYVTVHVEKSPAQLLRFVEEALPLTLIDTWRGVDWSGQPATIQLYEVQDRDASSPWEVDLASSEGRLHLAEGWSGLNTHASGFRYATSDESTLLLDLPDDGGTLHLDFAGASDGAMLRLNGHRLAELTINGPVRAAIQLPENIADELVDRLTITWNDEPATITELAGRDKKLIREIGNTGVSLPLGMTIAARSAGEEVGNFAHIYINGVDTAAGGRGYNLVATTSAGEILDSQSFDTHARTEASTEMATWLRQWPAGTIIVGAVADDASHQLQEKAIKALRNVGVKTDLRDKFRWGHAFVGVVNADEGTALEDSQLIAPSDVSIGPPVDAPAATGGIGRISFTSN